MEVFIAFHSEDQAIPMLDSAKRWAKCRGASPSIIQVPENGFEIKRRVLADNLAKEDYYILADMLCVPGDKNLVKMIDSKIKKYPDVNLFGLAEKNSDGDVSCSRRPSGVRICKKGAIEKWPQQVSDNYDSEHAEAAGNIKVISDLFYARIVEC